MGRGDMPQKGLAMDKERTAWMRQARQVGPEEWARRVGGMAAGPVRAKVATLVWWDFFGDRMAGERWGHLDGFLGAGADADVDEAALAAGLAAVGYPAGVAAERASQKGRQVLTGPSRLDEDGRAPGGRVEEDKGRRTPGAMSVFCSVCEQAQEDVRSLVAAGVVSPAGTIRADWPPKNHNGVVGYTGRAEVKDLLDWVLGGEYEEALRGLGINVGFDEVLAAIGLGKAAQRRVA